MKSIFFLFFAVLLCKPTNSSSQNVYKFTGNGSWKIAANWLNNLVPPETLTIGDSIIIDPSDECILDHLLSISNGAILVVNPGKKFTLLGYGSQITDSTFTDPRDGQVYPYKTIGTQVWMTKNLNYAAPGSWCYDDNANNCAIYGRLYTWYTARTIAPAGWHLPSHAEWSALSTFLGGENFAGGALKDTTLWQIPNIGATNISGFDGLPGGFRYIDNSYNSIGLSSYWWSSLNFNSDFSYFFAVSYKSTNVVRATGNMFDGFSIRCVKD